MKDGHLNKCKSCTKKDASIREKKLRKDPEWVKKEKKRGRDKYHRLNYKNKKNYNRKQKKAYNKYFFDKYPEKREAKNKTSHMKVPKGKNNHHWSYNKEHLKDVIVLDIRTHKKLHSFMIYDQERKMYRRCDNNVLLDTKEKHLSFIKEIEFWDY